MDIWTKQEEADALQRRFVDIENRAAFAREFKVPGGDSMINQHITGHRSISLKAATAYANGFKCSLEEISPRLANAAKQAAAFLPNNDHSQHNKVVAKRRPPTKREQRIDAIVALLQTIDMDGLAVILERTKDAARDYPLAKQTRK
jgi:hypothetical protein